MIAWTKGGEATLLRFSEPQVSVRSTIAAAPGTPLEGTLGGASLAIVVKVKSCKRDGATFVIEGRLVNLTRDLRAALALLATAPALAPSRGAHFDEAARISARNAS